MHIGNHAELKKKKNPTTRLANYRNTTTIIWITLLPKHENCCKMIN